jgi:hypothetical protein
VAVAGAGPQRERRRVAHPIDAKGARVHPPLRLQ